MLTVTTTPSSFLKQKQELCESWSRDWISMEGYEAEAEIPGISGAPSCEALSTLLMG
jgi:hypothetical protein